MSALQLRQWGPGIVGLGVLLSLSDQINILFLDSSFPAGRYITMAGLVCVIVGKWFSGAQGWKEGNKGAFFTSILCDVALIAVLATKSFGLTAILYAFGTYWYLRFLEPQYHRLKPGLPRYSGALLTKTCWLFGCMIAFSYQSNSEPALGALLWKLVYLYFLFTMASNVEPIGNRVPAYRPKWLDKHLQGSFEEVLERIENIRDSDARFEKIRKVGLQTMIWASFLGVVAMAVVLALTPGNSDQWLKYLFLSTLALTVSGFIVWRIGKSGDIEDSWHQALLRLHKYLASDVPEGATFDYKLNVAAIDVAPNLLGMSRFGSWYRRPRGTVSEYSAPIIRGQIHLRDGTKMSFQLTKMLRKKVTKKTNRRGTKWKTKSKVKYAERYTVQLKLPKSAGPVQVTNRPKLSSWHHRLENKLRVKASGRNVLVESSIKGGDEWVDVTNLLGLMIYAFRISHGPGRAQAPDSNKTGPRA